MKTVISAAKSDIYHTTVLGNWSSSGKSSAIIHSQFLEMPALVTIVNLRERIKSCYDDHQVVSMEIKMCE